MSNVLNVIGEAVETVSDVNDALEIVEEVKEVVPVNHWKVAAIVAGVAAIGEAGYFLLVPRLKDVFASLKEKARQKKLDRAARKQDKSSGN